MGDSEPTTKSEFLNSLNWYEKIMFSLSSLAPICFILFLSSYEFILSGIFLLISILVPWIMQYFYNKRKK